MTVEVCKLETLEAKLGETHPSTLASMSKLAQTYGDQGRREEAEILYYGEFGVNIWELGSDQGGREARIVEHLRPRSSLKFRQELCKVE
ncbi:hypothetical protein N7494_003724 [Penicillium frequentans]|uniref:Uncharacterized protein n=1 Tax=Penicillium frequentans TaxID=3151616 RepID=A0AAD6CZE8_9EURO|nr:hypothetical protein N7494_003724 [Penicillium glabrum]